MSNEGQMSSFRGFSVGSFRKDTIQTNPIKTWAIILTANLGARPLQFPSLLPTRSVLFIDETRIGLVRDDAKKLYRND